MDEIARPCCVRDYHVYRDKGSSGWISAGLQKSQLDKEVVDMQ